MQAKFDIPLVQKLSRMVQSRYDEDGRPPHRQPAAYDRAYNAHSDIFSVDCKTWNAMSPKEMHNIHRYRHILVTKVDAGKQMEFNADGLGMLADVDSHPVDIQCTWGLSLSQSVNLIKALTDSNKKDAFDSEAMLRKGKLRDLLSSEDEESGIAKNVLDLPLGQVPVPIPPRFSDISTDTYTHHRVNHLARLPDMRDVTSWGTAATRNAVSWFHCDDEGFSTSIWVLTGGKWWVIARRKKTGDDPKWDDPKWDAMSDVQTLNTWDVHEIDEDLWDLEAVYLESDSVL